MARDDLVKTIANMLKRRERSMSGKPETQFAPLIQDIIQNETVEKAKILLKTFFEMSENDPFIAQQIARLCMHNNEWDEAKEYAEKATSQKPDNSYLWDTYGRASLEEISSMYNKLSSDQYDVGSEDIETIVKLAFVGIDKFQHVQALSIDENSVYVNDAGFFGQLEMISKLLDCLRLIHAFRDTQKLHLFLVKKDYIPTELQFLEDIKGVNYLIKLKQLQSDVDMVVRQLEDEKMQLREGVLDEYRKGHNKISHEKLNKMKSSLADYFGEHDNSIPPNLSVEETCNYRRRYISYFAGNNLAQIYDRRFKEGGEEMLNTILEMTTLNIDAKFGNEQDYKVNLCACFALILISGKYIYKLNHSTIVEYSRQLYSLRNQRENHRFVSLEPYLFYVMLNWPGINTSDKSSPRIVLHDVLKQWKEAYFKKYPRQRDEEKPYKKRDTTMFFLANGSGFHSIASYEDLRSEMNGIKDEFWSQPHVLRKLKRFEGTLQEEGYAVKVKLETESFEKSHIILRTSFPVRQKDWWHKRVFFVIGFSWFGPKAYDINVIDPTADTENLTFSDDLQGMINKQPSANVDRNRESKQTHTHPKATSSANAEKDSQHEKKRSVIYFTNVCRI